MVFHCILCVCVYIYTILWQDQFNQSQYNNFTYQTLDTVMTGIIAKEWNYKSLQLNCVSWAVSCSHINPAENV